MFCSVCFLIVLFFFWMMPVILITSSWKRLFTLLVVGRLCSMSVALSRQLFSTYHSNFISKTRLYTFDPLKPHFYTVKLGFTGVYINFLIYANIDCGYSLEPPRRGGSNEYPQSMF